MRWQRLLTPHAPPSRAQQDASGRLSSVSVSLFKTQGLLARVSQEFDMTIPSRSSALGPLFARAQRRGSVALHDTMRNTQDNQPILQPRPEASVDAELSSTCRPMGSRNALFQRGTWCSSGCSAELANASKSGPCPAQHGKLLHNISSSCPPPRLVRLASSFIFFFLTLSYMHKILKAIHRLKFSYFQLLTIAGCVAPGRPSGAVWRRNPRTVLP